MQAQRINISMLTLLSLIVEKITGNTVFLGAQTLVTQVCSYEALPA